MKKSVRAASAADLWIKAFGSLLLNFCHNWETGLETLFTMSPAELEQRCKQPLAAVMHLTAL